MAKTVLLYLGILAACFWALPLLYPRVALDNAYPRSLERKVRDVQRIASPKILLAGGSNLTFGVNSMALEQALGRPVYNLAISADLGVEMGLEMAVFYARKGDVLLFSPEYLAGPASDATLAYLELMCPSATPFIHTNPNQKIRVQYQKAMATWRGLLRPLNTNHYDAWKVYRACGVNAHGDYIAHLSMPLQGTGKLIDILDFKSAYAPAFTRWLLAARNKGVVCYYLPQSYPTSGYAVYTTGITKVVAGMQACGWQQLCPPQAMLFADSLFYDSPNHLGAEGRALRTSRLVRILRPIVAALPPHK